MSQQEFEMGPQSNQQNSANEEDEIHQPQYPYSWSGKISPEGVPRDEPPSSYDSTVLQQGYREHPPMRQTLQALNRRRQATSINTFRPQTMVMRMNGDIVLITPTIATRAVRDRACHHGHVHNATNVTPYDSYSSFLFY